MVLSLMQLMVNEGGEIVALRAVFQIPIASGEADSDVRNG